MEKNSYVCRLIMKLLWYMVERMFFISRHWCYFLPISKVSCWKHLPCNPLPSATYKNFQFGLVLYIWDKTVPFFWDWREWTWHSHLLSSGWRSSDVFALFNGVLLVIVITFDIHTIAAILPKWDSYDLEVLICEHSKSNWTHIPPHLHNCYTIYDKRSW